MGDVLLMFFVFACGGFVGFVIAAVFAINRPTDEPEEFDGGWRTSNEPRVMTRIWHQSVEERE